YVAITLKVSDGYGGTNFLKVHLKGTRSEIWSVNENSNARTVVGRLFSRTASNPQADANSLSLSDFPAGLWTIDADRTGQVRVAKGATLDYETTSSYTGKILYTAGGVDAVVNITIKVTDLEAGKPGTPTLTRTTFSEQSDPALDATWTAAAANGTTISGYEAQYRKKVAQGETPNNWTAYSGTLGASATTFNLPDLTAGATYEVQVRAVTSDEGEGPWSDIGEGTANTPPTSTTEADLADSTIAVAAATDYDVSGKFTDADGDTLTYSASSAYPGVVTAAITGSDSDTLTATALNPAASTVTYGVSDPYGGYASRTVTITGQASASRNIVEGSPVGTTVGDPVTGSPYNGGTLTYALTGDAADAFAINSTTGQISVSATLDYETKSSYTGQVTWTVQGQPAAVSLTIEVVNASAPDAPDAPTVTQSTTDSTTSLDVAWTAPADKGAAITDYDVQYRVKAATGESPAAWTDHSFTGTGTSTTLTALTEETTYEVQVRAHNAEGAGLWSGSGEGATAAVVNALPQFSFQAQTRTVAENSPAGTLVGAPVTAIDTEGHTLTYTLTTESTPFVIDSATGQLSVAQGATLDYESQSTYSVVIGASDGLNVLGIGDGHIIDAQTTVVISVGNVNEPPPQPAAPSVTRSASSPTSALSVTWTAPEMRGKPAVTSYAISYRKAGDSAWENQPHSGLQTRATITGLDADTTYEVTIVASNADGSSPRSDHGTGSTALRRVVISPPASDPPPGQPEPPNPPGPGDPLAPGDQPTNVPTPEPAPPGTPTPGPTQPGVPTPGPTPPGTPTPGPTPPGGPALGDARSAGLAPGSTPGESRYQPAARIRLSLTESTPTPTPTPTGAHTATPTPTPTPTPEPTPVAAASTVPPTGAPPSSGSGLIAASGYTMPLIGDQVLASSSLVPLFLLLCLLVALIRRLRRVVARGLVYAAR
ncbi:MAG: fibronectin type III domain-containing protein, partial [Chloroflexi bacterium]|nr:fibronectin type III domain-containing protein [Chloroflexota bacterium]